MCVEPPYEGEVVFQSGFWVTLEESKRHWRTFEGRDGKQEGEGTENKMGSWEGGQSVVVGCDVQPLHL